MLLNILELFYSGNLSSIKELEDAIEHCEEQVEEWENAGVYDGDQGYQDDLMTLGALKEAFDQIDDFYIRHDDGLLEYKTK